MARNCWYHWHFFLLISDILFRTFKPNNSTDKKRITRVNLCELQDWYKGFPSMCNVGCDFKKLKGACDYDYDDNDKNDDDDDDL